MIITVTSQHWPYPLSLSFLHFFQSLSSHGFQKSSLMLIPFINSFAYLFAIIPEDIILFHSQLPSKSKSTKSHQNQLMHRKITMISTFQNEAIYYVKKNYIGIKILLGCINVFPHSLFFIYTWLQSYGPIQSFLNILLTSTLCYFVLKIKLYKHHYAALIILAVDLIIFYSLWTSPNLINQINKSFPGWWIFIGLSFLYIISSSAQEVLERYLIEQDYSSTPSLMLYEGGISLLIFIIFFIIINCLQCDRFSDDSRDLCLIFQWKVFGKDFVRLFNYSSIDTLYVWTYILFCFLTNYVRIEINQKLSPTHKYIAEMLGQFYWFVYNLCFTQEFGNDITRIIGTFGHVIVIIFACSVFNEYIILRCWGFEENTFKEIDVRGKVEAIDINEEGLLENEMIENNPKVLY